jgi:hypothetical protein
MWFLDISNTTAVPEVGVSSRSADVGGQAAKLSSLVAVRVASAWKLGIALGGPSALPTASCENLCVDSHSTCASDKRRNAS